MGSTAATQAKMMESKWVQVLLLPLSVWAGESFEVTFFRNDMVIDNWYFMGLLWKSNGMKVLSRVPGAGSQQRNREIPGRGFLLDWCRRPKGTDQMPKSTGMLWNAQANTHSKRVINNYTRGQELTGLLYGYTVKQGNPTTAETWALPTKSVYALRFSSLK